MLFFLQIPTGIISSLCSIILIYLTARLADDAAAGNAALFTRRLPVMLALLALQAVFKLLQDHFYIEYKARLGARLRERLYENRLDTGGASTLKGEILNLYNEGMEQLREYEAQKPELWVQLATMICGAAVMIWINPKLFAASIVLIPLCTWISRALNRRFREKAEVILEDKERINGDIKEILEGFYIIKAYLLEKTFLRHFYRDCDRLKQHEKEQDRLNTLAGRIEILLRYMPQLIIPLYGGWLCFEGQLQIGGLLAVNMLVGYVVLPMEALIRFFKSKKTIQPVREKLARYVAAPEQKGEIKWEQPGEGRALEVRQLGLSYGKNVIFQDFSMEVKTGEHLALMGESGCGKSTLLKIISGLFSGCSGTVRGPGREGIAYVPQEPYIFKNSIRENVCMGHNLSDQRLGQLLEAAGLKEETDQFPERTDTWIGEGGVRLSGGQIKRLAMARALAAETDMILMDEPMSALNPEKSAEVQKKLSRFLKGRTVVVVTHQELDAWENMRVIRLKRGEQDCEMEN